MARITVEDCLKQIPNRFQMVLVAAVRARQIANGHMSVIDMKDKPKDKAPVLALREIARGEVSTDLLRRLQ